MGKVKRPPPSWFGRLSGCLRVPLSGRKWPDSDPTLSGLRLLTRRFAQPSRAHHRPQFRGIEPCSLASCVRAVTVLPSDFSCDGKSAKLWSGASYAFRKPHHPVRSLVPSDGPVERIVGSTGRRVVDATRKQLVAARKRCGSHPRLYARTCLLGDLELYRPLRLLLHDCRPRRDARAQAYVRDSQPR